MYHWLTVNADEAERAKIDEAVFRPPLGTLAETGPWSPEATLAGFEAFAAGGPGVRTGRAG